jgi:hypothetical protein
MQIKMDRANRLDPRGRHRSPQSLRKAGGERGMTGRGGLAHDEVDSRGTGVLSPLAACRAVRVRNGA